MMTPVFGIFEGGGAKGLAHVAAVAAAEKHDIEFIGVAGASAGALIASLVAVGYKASELFDPNVPNSNILSRFGLKPLSLIGEKKWQTFQSAQKQVDCVRTARFRTIGFLKSLRLGLPAWGVAWETYKTGGYFSTDIVREKLNYYLRLKLGEHHAHAGRTEPMPERITFKDIDPGRIPECCSLKVIVTNLTKQRLVVFDNSKEYEDVEVAEAVAASIAIPLVFKPVSKKSYAPSLGDLFADGGLVSNAPIWVFAEEKLNFERTELPKSRVLIVAFTLKGSQTNSTAPQQNTGAASYLASVARAAIFGGQAVAEQFVGDLLPIEMSIDLETTEFDFDLQRGLQAYHTAYATASGKLAREVRVKPQHVVEILKTYEQDALRVINQAYPQLNVDRLRINLIKPFGSKSFRVVQSYNSENDADDRLVFSSLATGAPDAYRTKMPAFIDFGPIMQTESNANMTKYEFALVRRKLSSAICLPVFASPTAWSEPDANKRPQPLGVVAIDSDRKLDQVFSNPALLQTLATNSLHFNALLV